MAWPAGLYPASLSSDLHVAARRASLLEKRVSHCGQKILLIRAGMRLQDQHVNQ